VTSWMFSGNHQVLNEIVIPTEAKRSGGTCCFFSVHLT
jgi:hypothetical protein